jgi:hypothetical protein
VLEGRLPGARRPIAITAVALCLLSGCATAPMTQGGSLASYDNMTPSDGVLTKSLVRVNKDDVLAAKTVRIAPTAFSAAASPVLDDKQRILVANAVDRSLCVGLSDRFEVVGANETADLTVRATVTQAAATDEVAAGASEIVSIVPTVLSVNVPVPIPRIPIGLGSLTLEAEAIDKTHTQQAAMIWARGADSFTTAPRVSKAADAYDLRNRIRQRLQSDACYRRQSVRADADCSVSAEDRLNARRKTEIRCLRGVRPKSWRSRNDRGTRRFASGMV